MKKFIGIALLSLAMTSLPSGAHAANFGAVADLRSDLQNLQNKIANPSAEIKSLTDLPSIAEDLAGAQSILSGIQESSGDLPIATSIKYTQIGKLTLNASIRLGTYLHLRIGIMSHAQSDQISELLTETSQISMKAIGDSHL